MYIQSDTEELEKLTRLLNQKGIGEYPHENVTMLKHVIEIVH